MIEVPSLHLVQEKADELDRAGLDVHTVSVVINGSHGGWDVTIEGTDENLDNHKHKFILDQLGFSLMAYEEAT